MDGIAGPDEVANSRDDASPRARVEPPRSEIRRGRPPHGGSGWRVVLTFSGRSRIPSARPQGLPPGHWPIRQRASAIRAGSSCLVHETTAVVQRRVDAELHLAVPRLGPGTLPFLDPAGPATPLTQRPAIRWALAAAIVAVVGLLAYLGSTALTTAESSYLGSGRRYGSEDLAKIGRALDRVRVPYQIDDQRRVAVPSDQRDQAETAIVKLELGPRLPGEIRDQSPAAQIWESPPRQGDPREPGAGEDPRGDDQRSSRDRGFLRLDQPSQAEAGTSAGGQALGVRAAGNRRRSSAPVPHGAVDHDDPDRVCTGAHRRCGHRAGSTRPQVSRRGQSRRSASCRTTGPARRRLSQEILEQLDWIKGVRVSVQLPETVTAAAGVQSRPRRARAAGAVPGTAAPGRGPRTRRRALRTPGLPSSRSTSRWERPRLHPRPRLRLPAGQAREIPAEPGRIWVKVPRSYYYQVSILPSHKEPSQEELQKLVVRTEEQIKTGTRAGRAAVRPRIVEDDDRRDPRRGAAGPAPRGAVARRFAARGPGLGNCRRDGGDGGRAGDGRCVDPECPSLVGPAGGGQARAPPSRRICRVPPDLPSGFANSFAAIPNRRSACSSAGRAREGMPHDRVFNRNRRGLGADERPGRSESGGRPGSARRSAAGGRDRPASQGGDRAGQPGAIAGLAVAGPSRPCVGRGGDLGDRPAGADRPRRAGGRPRRVPGPGHSPPLLRVRGPAQDAGSGYSPGLCIARTTPPGPWPSPVRRRRCEPRSWVPWTPARRPRCGSSSRGSARSVSPTPRPPRPRSPSDSAVSTTRAQSACRIPAGAKRSWSDGSVRQARQEVHQECEQTAANRAASDRALAWISVLLLVMSVRTPAGSAQERLRRPLAESPAGRPGDRGAGSAAPSASRDPDLVRVPPPSGHLSRFGPWPAPRDGQAGTGKLPRLVAGIDGNRAGAGDLRGDLRRGAQVPPAGLGGARPGRRPGQPHAQALDLRGPGRPAIAADRHGHPGGPHAARRADRGRSGRQPGRAGRAVRLAWVGARGGRPAERLEPRIGAGRRYPPGETRNDRFAPTGSDIGWRPRG